MGYQHYLVCALVGLASISYAKPKVFVYCSEGSPSAFNPQIATDGTTFNNTRAIYNRLVEFKYGETTIEPGLAESWTVSPDGLEYTFKIRKGVSFHQTKYFTPSRTLNADDVIFSFNRQRLKSHPFHKVNGGSYEYFNAMDMGKLIKDVVRVNLHTVKFVLHKPESPFIANLAMDFASILSKEYADRLMRKGTPEKLDFEPIGTGPYVFKKYVKDQLVRYTANKTHFKGRPAMDRLIFSITQDPNVRFQKLKTGECHFATEPSPQDLQAMKAHPNIKVIEKSGLNVGYLAMNVEKKPFNNPLVRRAIHHALNRASYIDAIYLGNAKVAKNPIPPTIWSYNEKIKDHAYDPKLSKELLKKAGFEKGFSTELWTLPVSRPYNPNGKKMGEMMQADLAKVGIKVKLVTYDWPTYLAKSKNGEHKLLQLGWTGDNGDPDNFFHVLLGCSAVEAGANRARWCYKPFDKLILQAKQVDDRKKRTELYQKAQEIFKAQAPWVTLAHSVVYRAMAKEVQGYKIDPFGGDYFHAVDFKKIAE